MATKLKQGEWYQLDISFKELIWEECYLFPKSVLVGKFIRWYDLIMKTISNFWIHDILSDIRWWIHIWAAAELWLLTLHKEPTFNQFKLFESNFTCKTFNFQTFYNKEQNKY